MLDGDGLKVFLHGPKMDGDMNVEVSISSRE